eukprot:COSAG03_NODE_1923_length_3352_cov_2.871196_2_plen_264_part_00
MHGCTHTYSYTVVPAHTSESAQLEMMRSLALVSSLASVALAETYKPIIGVMTQPAEAAQDSEEFGPPVSDARVAAGAHGEYIAASYIKFVEAAGGRAVPIHYSADKDTLTRLAKSVNGILLPGGAVSLANSSVYYQAGQTLYDAAVKFNDAGEHFPIWGTCLGFEELARLLSGSNDQTLSPHKGEARFDSENYPVSLQATVAMARSRMFGSAPAELITAITTENITMNNHGKAVRTPMRWDGLPAVQRVSNRRVHWRRCVAVS